MSYLRIGSDGHYIDLSDGGIHYIYNTGPHIIDQINGKDWSHGEFAALLSEVAHPAATSTEDLELFYQALENEFDTFDPSFEHDLPQAVKAEVFCRVIDGRTHAIELTDEHVQNIKQWLDD